MDLIDPNLSIINMIKINQFIIDGIENLLFNIIQISNNSTVDFSIIQEKLNQELDLIIPNVIPDLLFHFNFDILKALLYKCFLMNLKKFIKLLKIISIILYN